MFKEGDQVMLAVTARKLGVSPKLQPRWEGPYKIEKKVGDVNFKIRGARGKFSIVHMNRLKPYKTEMYVPGTTATPDNVQPIARQTKPPMRFGEWLM